MKHRFVTGIVPYRRIKWIEQARFPGILNGEYNFEVRHHSNGYCALVQRVESSGIMLPFVWNSVAHPIAHGFIRMNAALKSRAEANHAQ